VLEKRERAISEVKYMQMNWDKEFKYDPSYNYNLTARDEDFSLRVFTNTEWVKKILSVNR
jgi:hypothetical protein